MLKQDQPIGLFDSGVGGLTVLRRVIELLPEEDTLYFGDSARLPYGDKSPQTIVRYALQNSQFLLSHKVKALVIACNTASAHAVEFLKESSPVPVIDVIEPAVLRALQLSRSKKIGVLGTKATILSKVYETKIKKLQPRAQVVQKACPLFVPLVEEEFVHHPAATLIVREYLQPLKDSGVDTLILGCTHYPLLTELIQDVLGKNISIIDSASACAETVLEVLKKDNLKRNLLVNGERKYYVSDDPEKFRRIGERFLGTTIENVEIHIHEEN